MFVEFIDVTEKNLGVNFLFAFEIEVNRTLTELGLFGNAIDCDRAETILEKKPPCCPQYGIFPIFPFSFSSFYQSQDLIPSVLVIGLKSYFRAGDTNANFNATAAGCNKIVKMM